MFGYSNLHLLLQPQNEPGVGELALGPLMFGASSTLLNADHYEVYFKGMPLWNGKVNNFLLHFQTSRPSKTLTISVFHLQVLRRHGDLFERTSRGYYHAHGRADDTMNLGGIKV